MSQRNLDRMPYGEREPSLYERVQERLSGIDVLPDSDRGGGEGFPETRTYDVEEVHDLFMGADGVYRELPLTAWDPSLMLDHVEGAYVGGKEAATELAYLSEEWRLEETEVEFYHDEGLRGRGTLRMEYDGEFPVEEKIEVPFRVDVEQYVSRMEAGRILAQEWV